MSGYRGIKPMLTFESDIHPLRKRQFHWSERDKGLEIATFAGKEMMACVNDDGATYQLTYLDMAHPTPFSALEEAKEAAPDFARAVLLTMLEYVGVREGDTSLRRCLAAGGQ